MVYVTGDIHGDEERLSKSALKALDDDDTLVICGDFGFIWNSDKREEKILNSFAKRKYNICFVDGTHENFAALGEYPQKEWHGGKVHEIRHNVYHLMRGQLFEIDGLTIFTMGGGESPDIDVRAESAAWSRDEIPTQAELMEGAEKLDKVGCRVDVIITHEPPSRIKSFLKLGESTQIRVTALNTYFDELSESCDFTRWFFGSLHMDKYISGTHTCVFKELVNAHTGERVKRK